jgi:hypothetical protein
MLLALAVLYQRFRLWRRDLLTAALLIAERQRRR